MDGVPEEIIQEQVVKAGVLVKGRLDVAEEARPDDAASSPHQSNAAIVEVPAKLLGSLEMTQFC